MSTLGDDVTTLPRNVGLRLPIAEAPYPRRTDVPYLLQSEYALGCVMSIDELN
jgi:hypothetical protein